MSIITYTDPRVAITATNSTGQFYFYANNPYSLAAAMRRNYAQTTLRTLRENLETLLHRLEGA